jgi:predicted dehydrogenase
LRRDGILFVPFLNKRAMPSHLTIVVEGIGQVVQRHYAPPLKAIKEKRPDEVNVIFCDESSCWKNATTDDELDRKTQFEKFISSLSGWADYIDKTTARERYDALSANVVLIATPDDTHTKIALDWLRACDRCDQIFIEKPLDSDVDRARDFLLQLNEDDPKVRALDHYRARVLPVVHPLQRKAMVRNLGGGIKRFAFYFTEDGSGPPRGGPLENELRDSLKNGLIMDLMPHIPAILSYFGIMETIRLTGLRAARYTYEFNGEIREAKIQTETFAHIGFSFMGREPLAPKTIHGDAYLGKGIKGSRRLERQGNLKLLVLEGVNSKQYHFDFVSGKVVEIGKRNKRTPFGEMYHDPYAALIRRIVRQKLDDQSEPLIFDLPVESAKNILVSIDEMRHPLKNRTEPLPLYHITAEGAPYLEDVVEAVEPIVKFLYPPL